MKDFLQKGKHPQLNYSFSPDLGGTSFDFVKEVNLDKVVYSIRYENNLTKLAIPKNGSFLYVSVENLTGGKFLEARYDNTGNLIDANIWFCRYCEQNNFNEKAKPDDQLLAAYDQLKEMGAEVMFGANLQEKNLKLYLCSGNSTLDDLQVMSGVEIEIPHGVVVINFHPLESDEMIPIPFCISVSDNVLSLGIKPNDGFIVKDQISTVMNLDRLSGKPTPREVRMFLDAVFLRY